MLHLSVANPRESVTGALVVNVTSQSSMPWARELSPFFLGPVDLYDGMVARNVENAWQYSKVYRQFLDRDGKLSTAYWDWAKAGWNKTRADRYPMGKGAIPEFSYWNGNNLGYVDAREQVYCPLYAKSVVRTQAFQNLKNLVEKQAVTLIDFDVYASGTKNLYAALKDPHRKFGHGFVLYGLLTGEIDLNGEFIRPEKHTRSLVQQKIAFERD